MNHNKINQAGFNEAPLFGPSKNNPPIFEKYSIPIYENGVKTEWSVDGVVGDEKYIQLIKLGNGKDLPDIINTRTK